MLPLILFFLCWIAGMCLLFLYLKNRNHELQFQDVLFTYILSTAVGVVFAFAGYKANLFHWVTCIAYAGLAAYITHKFLEKKGSAQLKPEIDVPTLNRMSAYGSKPRPGSMAAADQAANRNFVLGAAVIYILIILAWTVFDTDMHTYYISAPRAANIIGLTAFVVSYLVIFNSHKQVLPAKSGHWYWIGWAILAAFGLWCSIGFQG